MVNHQFIARPHGRKRKHCQFSVPIFFLCACLFLDRKKVHRKKRMQIQDEHTTHKGQSSRGQTCDLLDGGNAAGNTNCLNWCWHCAFYLDELLNSFSEEMLTQSQEGKEETWMKLGCWRAKDAHDCITCLHNHYRELEFGERYIEHCENNKN